MPVHVVGQKGWCETCFFKEDVGINAPMMHNRRYCRVLKCPRQVRQPKKTQGYCIQCHRALAQALLAGSARRPRGPNPAWCVQHGRLVRTRVCQRCYKPFPATTRTTKLCRTCYLMKAECPACGHMASLHAFQRGMCNTCVKASANAATLVEKHGVGNHTGAAIQGDHHVPQCGLPPVLYTPEMVHN